MILKCVFYQRREHGIQLTVWLCAGCRRAKNLTLPLNVVDTGDSKCASLELKFRCNGE